MISFNDFHEDDAREQEVGLRARDRKARRRAELPIDYKFDRAPRGPATNQLRRRRKQAPIRGINNRRIKKVL